MGNVLSLDLGTSSVGWALFESDDDLIPKRLIDVGVRHFEEVVEPKSKMLKNAKRRQTRGMRKNLRRRRQRLDLLLGLLQTAGLAPGGPAPFGESEATSDRPYELRAIALTERLEPVEIGRALYHLARRRGFKSNRGAMLATLHADPEVQDLLSKKSTETQADGDQEMSDEERQGRKELTKTLEEIEGLRKELNGRTLGQFFWEEIRAGKKVRGRHTDRSMYEDEYERIWKAQGPHHGNTLSESLKARIHDAIFNQRPLKLQKFLKSNCSLEKGKPRAERAQLVSQRFRYWQDLANLEFRRGGEFRKLNAEEKAELAAKLEEQGSMAWSEVAKLAGLDKTWSANLQRTPKDKLKGNGTAARIRARAQDTWNQLDEPGREWLVEIMLTIPDRGVCYRTLKKKFDLDTKTAYDLATLELEAGTVALSAKAMRRMLPHMREGESRAEAQISAGYEPWNDAIALVDKIANSPSQKEIPNPRVRKALGQVRKVVNAIVREYGKPIVIRLELSREMSLTKKEKEGKDRANKLLKSENERADEQLRVLGIQNPTRADRIWYRLGEQCNWICPYCGKGIEQQPSTGNAHIEHIVPYTRCLDDSFNNLTLSHAECNRAKACRTPFEAFGATSEWEGMLGRIRRWKNGPGINRKRKLFAREEMADEDKMVSRQLNETRWICRAAADFLRPICDIEALASKLTTKLGLADEESILRAQKTCVEVTNGKATAMLREHWALMTMLPDHESSEKTRDDLRHHAIDAVAVAFTTRAVFQKLTAYRKKHSDGTEADVEPLSKHTVPPLQDVAPWLHEEVCKRLASVIVSHESTRHLSDALHEETALGLRNPAGKEFHVRRKLADMTKAQISAIVDMGLRASALQAFEAARSQVGEKRAAQVAFSEGLKLGKERHDMAGRILQPVIAHRARFAKSLPKSEMLGVPRENPHKFFELGNNHHVEIFENQDGKREFRFVSTKDAARRARIEKRPIVDTTPPAPGFTFVTWLAQNDMVQVPDDGAEPYKVGKLDPSGNRLYLRPHTAARADAYRQPAITKGVALVKLEVNVLGRVREATTGVV